MEHSVNKSSVIKSTGRNKSSERPIALETQRGRDELGRVKTLYKIDLSSGHFGAQFTRAFELSVARARKENKRPSSRKNLANAAE